MDEGRPRRGFRYSRPPVPPRRLLLLFLLRQSGLGGWRAIVLGPSLPQLLGSSQSSGPLILFLGLDSIHALRCVNREIVAIFQQILDSFHFEQRSLRRAYYYDGAFAS